MEVIHGGPTFLGLFSPPDKLDHPDVRSLWLFAVLLWLWSYKAVPAGIYHDVVVSFTERTP